MATKIFISYRREPGSLYAMLLHDRLKNMGYEVFIDKESLKLGRFDDQILKQIEQCNYFILVLTPNALERVNNAGDWMRLEIEHAINSGKKIIPIIDKKFTAPHILPSEIEILMSYQGIETEMADTNQLHFVLNKLTEYCTPKPRPLKNFFAMGTVAVVFIGIVAFMLPQTKIEQPQPPNQTEQAGNNNGDIPRPPFKPNEPNSGETKPKTPEVTINPPNEGNNGDNQTTPPIETKPIQSDETIKTSNSTVRESGKKIYGSNNEIYGNNNEIYGSNNEIQGDYNKIIGSNNDIFGNYNEIFGSNNTADGYGNKVLAGSNNDV